jgi:uncharacterized beta barrel domain-containing protein DUF5777
MKCFRAVLLTAAFAVAPVLSFAQNPPAPPPSPPDATQSDPDVRVDALQPDFNLVALPTTLRLPRHKWSFRVTHRFTRSLGQGDFGDLASDLFGLDSAAQVGLELRYGIAKGTQLGVHRTSDRTIQIFGQHNFLNERDGAPFGLDAIATLEGRNNLREQYQSALGVALSKYVMHRAAVYAEPLVVLNTNPAANAGSDNNTMMIGLGTRVRVLPSMYLTAEMTPRFAGFDPGANQISFGLEGRAGGHLFQVNVSNGFGTTLGQIAGNGAFNYDNWYIGFNIARKFF